MSNVTRYPFPGSNSGHQQSPAPKSNKRSKRRVFDSARGLSALLLALFAGSAHKLSSSVVDALDAMAKRRARKRAEDHLWLMAQSDPRLMADLQGAMARQQD